MRKILQTVFAVSFFLSCSPKIEDVNIDDLDITVSAAEPGIDFSQYKTFAIPDSVYIIEYDEQGNQIDTFALTKLDKVALNQVNEEMSKLGYTKVDTSQNPDVGIFISRISESHSEVGFTPGYCSDWGGGYWGYPGYGWCYPSYGYEYEYKTGSVIVDMIDMSSINQEENTFTVVWHMLSNGYLSGDTPPTERRVKNNISRGFEQSQYLKTN